MSGERAVLQRVQRILDQLLPLGDLEPAGEEIGIVRRRRDQGEDLAVPGIERDDRADLAFELALGLLLQLGVDGEGQRSARAPDLAPELLDRLAVAVDDHDALAVLAAQACVVLELDAAPPDPVADPQSLERIGELLRSRLAEVAQNVGRLDSQAVEAAVRDVDLELWMRELFDLEARHLVERQALGEEHRLEGGHAAVALEESLELGERPVEDRRREFQAGREVGGPAAVEQQVVAREVLDQDAAVAVEDRRRAAP